MMEKDIVDVVCSVIDGENSALRELSLDIWNNPELCFQEHHAHKIITNFLQERGFQVEKHYKLETAFKATFSNADDENAEDCVNAGVLCEYDALPGIGHACGHNLIAIIGVSVALGIKKAMETTGVKGKLTVLGTPAEEGGGGKIDLINAGAFKDLDFALMAHPGQNNLPKPNYVANSMLLSDIRSLHQNRKNVIMTPFTDFYSWSDLPSTRIDVVYEGKASHAASAPWNGINALDAAVLCYQNVSCMRQHMRPSWRVHGIIKHGGEQPNIIPEMATLQYYARAPTLPELEELKAKLVGCFEGASRATGCEVKYTFAPKPYHSLVSNSILASLYQHNGEALGIEFEKDPTQLLKQGGSTDMGNVSRVLPGIHPKFKIEPIAPGHTRAFRDISKSESSHSVAILHAKSLALAAIEVMKNPSLCQDIKNEFKASMASGI